ncbi:ribosomal protein S6 kinase delta-1-like [Oppia nitens]|uniref:ribosomal protein S6 kinase delta-1-like n=1 Tax=Oppia nitens TaxID=1686743 RepID=UPI0023DC1212|nr:ribosomal protein S6 kinase delta-1-like [Oppia nitens]
MMTNKAAATAATAINVDDDGWIRQFNVTDPCRHPQKGYTVYKVVSRVHHRSSTDGITELVAYKRYSEFKRLHKTLGQLHQSLHLKGMFPDFPDSKLFGRFDADVIETRRRSALELLEFAAKHTVLFTSTVFVQFFDNSVTNFTTTTTTTTANNNIVSIDSHITDDADINDLPKPLEPSLSFSDDGTASSSYRTGGGDGGVDGDDDDNTSNGSTSVYSTPVHTMDNNHLCQPSTGTAAADNQNSANRHTSDNLTEFDPLANGSDNPKSCTDDNNDDCQSSSTNDWLFSPTNHPKLAVVVAVNDDNDNQNTKNKELSLPSTPSAADNRNNCDNNNKDVINKINNVVEESYADDVDVGNDDRSARNVKNLIKTFDDIPTDIFVKQFSISCDSDHLNEDDGNDNVNQSSTTTTTTTSGQTINPSIDNNCNNNNNNKIVVVVDGDNESTAVSSDNYLLDAAIILRQAQQHEESGEWEPAFESYKCAVGILLQGVVDELDTEKKASIRRKTFQYLTRAEHIFDTYLSDSSQHQQPSRRWAPDSPFKSLNASLIQSWFGTSDELIKYRVCGIDGGRSNSNNNSSSSSRVQIVMDTTNNNRKFVIKVVYKSNYPYKQSSMVPNQLSVPQSIFPNDIPFMVQIYRIFKTDYAIYLLLEYAKGGRLWDRLLSANGSRSLSPCPDCTFAAAGGGIDDKDYELIADNAYSGRRISRTCSEYGSVGCGNKFKNNVNNNNNNSVFEPISERMARHRSSDDSMDESSGGGSPSGGSLASIDSIDYDLPSKSYVNLCHNYALERQRCPQQQQQQPTSSLANCKLGHISDSIDSIDSITEDYDNDSYNNNNNNNNSLSHHNPNPSLNANPYNNNNNNNSSNIMTSHSLSRPPIRQLSIENMGITSLLTRAKSLLRNVDQTLNLSKYVSKNLSQKYLSSTSLAPTTTTTTTPFSDHLRGSKSELSLSSTNLSTQKQMIKSLKINNNKKIKKNKTPISEVIHQMDDNNTSNSGSNGCCTDGPLVSESEARLWLSQVVRCLQHLHKLGAVYCDLNPDNLLLNDDNNVCVTYKCFWDESPQNSIDELARERLYVAPELMKSEKVSHLCDWWSFGVVAYELLTARSLVSYHPNGITSHTTLYFPAFISIEAKDLITKLLQPNPSERLGRHGSEEITTHPFFEGINWSNH